MRVEVRFGSSLPDEDLDALSEHIEALQKENAALRSQLASANRTAKAAVAEAKVYRERINEMREVVEWTRGKFLDEDGRAVTDFDAGAACLADDILAAFNEIDKRVRAQDT